MSQPEIQLRPIDPRAKRRIIAAVTMGLILGSVLIFTVVYSSAKQQMIENQKKKEETQETSNPQN